MPIIVGISSNPKTRRETSSIPVYFKKPFSFTITPIMPNIILAIIDAIPEKKKTPIMIFFYIQKFCVYAIKKSFTMEVQVVPVQIQ